ncbi:MAG: hypothetical protein COW01_09850 [Bdellovibrionales bacterium CG12_big_fil_rev_8_21_14_0_65_38_15]|nr:MAG: hypothetical protein COW79_06635 [Bdellovibrionales bacterium CG22_combo_CG10-13_8_21_14_all_38_13]PIQ54439.1 MAG: hypothetical protein COW01_09850 [Bdellovibrionales bacterium CG12_big_fil_rev_8_21_14_0_65_38_15]PIR31488.1 MAG: hypothetical protein COV38_00175 [Bdellovibrionales bacterium CG11_big_fil_rev_8_21_14_0_20_38_13]
MRLKEIEQRTSVPYTDEELGLKDNQLLKGSVIYLDQNIYGRLIDGNIKEPEKAKDILKVLGELHGCYLPFSFAHIYEVLNIPAEKMEYREKHLKLIKEISGGISITYRYDMERFTIKPECPFEVFQSIVESEDAYKVLEKIPRILEDESMAKEAERCGVSRETLEGFDIASVQLVKGVNLRELLESLSTKEQIQETRLAFGLDPKVLNNMSMFEAINFIDQRIKQVHEEKLADETYRQQYLAGIGNLKPMTIASSIDYMAEKILQPNGIAANEFSKLIMLASLLETYGFQSQQLNKNQGAAFYDHIHFAIAQSSHLFLSRDEKLIKKIGKSKAIYFDNFLKMVTKDLPKSP